MEFFRDLFKTDFMPHGHCYYWRPDVLWSNVLGDAGIAVAYFAIPFLLNYFVKKREGLRFSGIFILFALFILLCGTTHILSIVSVWAPVYRLEGLTKILTAAVSLYTGYVLMKNMPQALTIPTPAETAAANKKLREANELLKRKTDQLEGQNDFLGKLAFATYHDLREPVRSMSMNSQLLLHKHSAQMSDDGKQILPRISDEGKRMYNSVDSILKFTFLESEKYMSETVSLERVMALVEKNLRQQISESFASIQYNNLPAVRGNERLLIILFENILSNSIYFHSDQPPLISIAATAEGPHCVITISDNGTGFDSSYSEKIFEMFQRLGNPASSYRGAGLGLSLCRRITEILGGSICADSAEGMGTVITVRLPQA
jgi:chemotaxis family two-component system sensor kinase Cph1